MTDVSSAIYRAPLGGLAVDEAMARIAELAEDSSGAWTRAGSGGRLAIPVAGGLRRGWVGGEISVERPLEHTDDSEHDLVFRIEEEHWSVHVPSVGILVFAAGGALSTVLWPFVPALVPLAPMGLVLAIGAWFLVIRQIRHRGPREFLDLIVAEIETAESAPENLPEGMP